MTQSRPVGHRTTPYHTPYHVVQLSLALLKSTFSTIGPDNYPFRYDDDLDKSGIAIDTVYNKEARIIGNKPTIAIARGAIQAGQIALGDRAEMAFPENKYYKTNTIQSSVEYRISTRHHSECEIFGNEFFNFLIACRTMLPRMVGLQHINSLGLSPVQQSEQDDKIYVSTASFQYVMQYQWYHIEPEQLLESLHIYLQPKETDYDKVELYKYKQEED